MALDIKKTTETMQAALKAARDLADLTAQEQRDFTEEERTQVAGHLKAAKEAKAELEKANADAEMVRAINELGEGIALAPVQKPAAKNARPAATLGERFTTAEEWVSWLKANTSGGVIPESRKGLTSPPLMVKDFGLFGQKAVVTGFGDDSGGAFVVSDRTDIYEPLGRYPLNIRDLITVRQTTSDTVEYVRQLTQVNAATPVPEANVTTYTGATGEVSGLKPEGSLTFQRISTPVKTVAVWIPATKRALSDAAQLRGMIDTELREDLAEELENQILNGDGVGENFEGIATTAGTLAQAFVTDALTTTRKALTHLLVTGKQMPTGWMLNPVDWEAFDLTKDLEGRYYWGGPMAMGQRQLWGSPVVQGFYQPQGAGWLANWRKAVLWDREQATVSITDSHADFFIRNMVAILAEFRAAMGVTLPRAWVEVDLEAGS